LNRRQLQLVTGAAALLGLVAGLASSPSREPSGLGSADVEWQLPDGASLLRHDSANLQPIGQFPWKGAASAEAEAEAAKAPAWYLRGIVNDPAPTALVDDGQGKILRFRTGDLLPNGASLVRIEANRIEFQAKGCLTVLDLHRQPAPATAQAGECTSDNPSIPGNNP
jgi:hypothetical protein